MPKTEFLQIRVSPGDKGRIEQAAEAQYLDASTWARAVILRAVEEWEKEKGSSEDRPGSRGE